MATEDIANMTLHDRLVDIQNRLKVPKDINNDFGGFKYRDLSDIEEKVKPLLYEHNCTLTFEDDVIEAGGRVYIKAYAIFSDGTDEIRKSALAREAVQPKAKMDDAQLTGSCSSYARKYAAGGLFLIDDTKDADSRDNSINTKTPVSKVWPIEPKPKDTEEPFDSKVTEAQLLQARELLEQTGYATELIEGRLKLVKTSQQARELIAKLEEQE